MFFIIDYGNKLNGFFYFSRYSAYFFLLLLCLEQTNEKYLTNKKHTAQRTFTTMKYVIYIELAIFFLMISAKAVMLRRNGITALKFGKPDKNAVALILTIAGFAYAASAGAMGLPFPAFAGKLFWNIPILNVLAILICTISLIWFGITLVTFGHSFRIGIDEKTNDKLITTGTFTLSRNPVFLAFIVFFLGVFLTYPNMITLLFLCLLIMMAHRQIIKEEIFLRNHYGNEYEQYCTKVRRYI